MTGAKPDRTAYIGMDFKDPEGSKPHPVTVIIAFLSLFFFF